jgi:hypothetical protein
VDAYQIMLVADLVVLGSAFAVFTVLRIRFPIIPPMAADTAHREFVARRFRDLQS